MLRTLLTYTKLNEKAFWPKPVNKDFLECSDEFWRKKYQEQDISHESELNYIFSILLNAVAQLTLTQDCVKNIISTIKNFQINCNTPLFANYIEGIKKKLEIITFYFSLQSLSQKKNSLALKLLDINVCPEGSFLKIQQIAYALSESSNIFSWLAKFRLEIIYRYLYTLRIQSVHDLNSILNYAQSIGLNVFEEERITQAYIANDHYRAPFSTSEKEEFLAFFCGHYCVEGIIQYITNRLENELKIRLHEFQQEVPGFGWVISDQIPPYSIEKKLNGLPIKKIHRLVETISEDNDSYYRIKPTRELKKEVARQLSKIGVFKKRSKKIKLNGNIWKFSILEGDNFGEYAYISNKVKPFPRKKFPPSVFEEKKIYEYFTLEKFNSSKSFLILGQASFTYFYQQGADFNYCYLIDIDFKGWDTDFFSLNRIKDAYLIRPQVSYQQFLSFYELRKHKAIQSNCVVEFTNTKQFFTIIQDILDPELENRDEFITRHKNILASKALHSEFLKDLDKKKSEREVQLAWIDKQIKNNERWMKIISFKALLFFTVIAFIVTLFGTLSYYPLCIGCALLLLDAFWIQYSVTITEQTQLNQACYHEQIILLKKEYDKYHDLITILIGLRDEKLIAKETDLIVADDGITTEISCILKNNTKPTNISKYLLKGLVEFSHRIIPKVNLVDYRFRIPRLC